VCFSPEADDIVYLPNVAPASTMTNEERASAWYTYEDMLHMKEQAKTLARRIRSTTTARTATSSPTTVTTPDETTIGTERQADSKRRLDEEYPTNFPPQSAAIEEISRGLELRIFLGRQLKKYIAARAFMEHQQKHKRMIDDAEKSGDKDMRSLRERASDRLRDVSRKYSLWARNAALEAGLADFKAIQGQDVGECGPVLSKRVEGYMLSRKRRSTTSNSGIDFDMAVFRKKQMIGAQQATDGCFIPIDGMRRNIPVNIF